MHFKLLQSAEPLKAEALLLRGEDVRALRPRERLVKFGTKTELISAIDACVWRGLQTARPNICTNPQQGLLRDPHTFRDLF